MGSKTKIDWCGKEWFQIPGHMGYFASMDGQILSTKKKEFRIMKQISSHDGHLYVFMYDNGNMKKVWVHRAVLSASRGYEEKALECRHLDDNPNNNCIGNLAWGSRLQNTEDKRRNGRIPVGEQAGASKLNSSQVMEIRQRYADGEYARDLAKEFGINSHSIYPIVRGNEWRHLPIIPVRVKHSTARITPSTKESIEKMHEGAQKYLETVRKPRIKVFCACGCGTVLETPDSKGRDRKYIHGHNANGKHWRWKNGTENENSVL